MHASFSLDFFPLSDVVTVVRRVKIFFIYNFHLSHYNIILKWKNFFILVLEKKRLS